MREFGILESQLLNFIGVDFITSATALNNGKGQHKISFALKNAIVWQQTWQRTDLEFVSNMELVFSPIRRLRHAIVSARLRTVILMAQIISDSALSMIAE
jgi:hypothetical protein